MSAVLSLSQSGAVSDAAAVHLPHATLRTVAHAQLVRSPLNVRRKRAAIEELVALIAAQDLLQNLIGTEQLRDGRPTGCIEIVAGERRRCAIGVLIADGRLPVDYGIPVLLVDEHEAIAISLSENLGREPMHAADICEAMLAMAARGVGIDDIALGFGVPPLEVRRRLRLANVAPRFISLYRADTISLEQLMALAVSDDHAAQEQVWEALDPWARTPQQIKRALTRDQVDARHDPVARFVGLAAFAKAGGQVERDLFSDVGAGYIRDTVLLDRLATDRLERHAKALRAEGWGWISVRPRLMPAELAQYGKGRTERASTGTDQHAPGDPTNPASCASAAPCTDAGARRQGEAPSARAMALVTDRSRAGCIVTLDHEGKPTILRDLIRPEDRAALHKLPGAAPAPVARPDYSERLLMLLTAQRTQALHAGLLVQPTMALVLVVHDLVQVALDGDGAPALTGLRCRLPAMPEEARTGPAHTAVSDARAAWKDRLPTQGLLDWLLQQDQATLLELLAWCVGASLDTLGDHAHANSRFTTLASRLGLDMHQWWKPTAAGMFDLMPRARQLAVVSEALGEAAAVPLERLPKDALAAATERTLTGSGWLPPCLKTEDNCASTSAAQSAR